MDFIKKIKQISEIENKSTISNNSTKPIGYQNNNNFSSIISQNSKKISTNSLKIDKNMQILNDWRNEAKKLNSQLNINSNKININTNKIKEMSDTLKYYSNRLYRQNSILNKSTDNGKLLLVNQNDFKNLEDKFKRLEKEIENIKMTLYKNENENSFSTNKNKIDKISELLINFMKYRTKIINNKDKKLFITTEYNNLADFNIKGNWLSNEGNKLLIDNNNIQFKNKDNEKYLSDIISSEEMINLKEINPKMNLDKYNSEFKGFKLVETKDYYAHLIQSCNECKDKNIHFCNIKSDTISAEDLNNNYIMGYNIDTSQCFRFVNNNDIKIIKKEKSDSIYAIMKHNFLSIKHINSTYLNQEMIEEEVYTYIYKIAENKIKVLSFKTTDLNNYITYEDFLKSSNDDTIEIYTLQNTQ